MFTIIYIAQESTMALYHPPWMVGILVAKGTCSHLIGTHPPLKKETEAYQSEILPLQ